MRDNVIHDSYGAGVMVFGMSDKSRNISNASIVGNVFARNGAQQTSGDHGEINFVQPGSTGTVRDNIFFSVQDPAADPAAARAFVYQERVPGTLEGGWELANNTIMGARADVVARMAPTPQIADIAYSALPGGGGVATASIVNRAAHTPGNLTAVTVMWTLDGSLPRAGQAGTWTAPLAHGASSVTVAVNRTAALNVRFAADGMLDSFTATVVVPIPAAPDATCV